MTVPAGLKIGPADITFKGVNLGFTSGGVTVGVKFNFSDIVVDQLGGTILDKINQGSEVTVAFALATLTKTNRALIYGTTVEIGGGGEERVIVTDQTGCSLANTAGLLTLKPIVCGTVDTDIENWIQFPNAQIMPETEEAFSPDALRAAQLSIQAFPEVGTNRIVHFGALDGEGGF